MKSLPILTKSPVATLLKFACGLCFGRLSDNSFEVRLNGRQPRAQALVHFSRCRFYTEIT